MESTKDSNQHECQPIAKQAVMGGEVGEEVWEQIEKFVSEKSEGSNWEDAYWISFSKANGESFCPNHECPEEVSDILEKHFEITTGMDLETCWFNYDNCKKVADLICEHFAENWYKHYIESVGTRAESFEEYKDSLSDSLIDGSGSQESDLFEFDEISGKRLNSWPINEDSVIEELELLLESDGLDVDDWESIDRIINGFDDNSKVRNLVFEIVKKAGFEHLP